MKFLKTLNSYYNKYFRHLFIDKYDNIVKSYLFIILNSKRTGDWDAVPIRSYEISRINVKTKKKFILIFIYLGRPGYFIGEGGRNLDIIKAKMEELLKYPIRFKLIENMPFNSYGKRNDTPGMIKKWG